MAISRRAFLGQAAAIPAIGAVGETDASGTAEPQALDVDPTFQSAFGHDITTDAVHAGEEEGFSVTPIYPGKNYKGGYQRPPHNPTVGAFEVKLKSLEGAEFAVSAPCGMSIITQTHLTFLSAGDRLVTHRCVYDNVMNFFRHYLPRFGVEVVFIDMNDLDQLRKALQKPPKIVHWEPYVNPTMEVLDSPEIIRLAKEAGAMTVVDNTWLTPYLFQPIRRGADLVVHSATKYISGHGSAMGGVVAGSKSVVQKIESTIGVMGGILRPFDAFLLDQGLKTLPLRMRRHSQTAKKVAKFLEGHPRVQCVRYGGLPSWPGNKIGKTYLSAFGGMIGVEWKDDATHQQFPKRLKLCKPWASLGDVVTLVQHRSEDSGRGIPKRYTRISIGLEDAGDIIADFKQALE
jgi:methionine-gamma-lyase